MRTTLLSLALAVGLAPSVTSQGTPSLAHAKQQFNARNWDMAKREYTALATSAPGDGAPAFYLGRIALQENDTDEGIRQFERCISLDEKNAECHAWLGNALGMTAQRTNKFKLPFLVKRTKKEFDRAVELDPANLDGRMGEMQYYLFAPSVFGGSTDKAREQAAEIDRRDKLRGAMAHGLIADHEKDAKTAEAAYQRAIAAAPVHESDAVTNGAGRGAAGFLGLSDSGSSICREPLHARGTMDRRLRDARSHRGAHPERTHGADPHRARRRVQR